MEFKGSNVSDLKSAVRGSERHPSIVDIGKLDPNGVKLYTEALLRDLTLSLYAADMRTKFDEQLLYFQMFRLSSVILSFETPTIYLTSSQSPEVEEYKRVIQSKFVFLRSRLDKMNLRERFLAWSSAPEYSKSYAYDYSTICDGLSVFRKFLTVDNPLYYS